MLIKNLIEQQQQKRREGLQHDIEAISVSRRKVK